MSISIRQMRAFYAVMRTGSFTGAARQLHLTQSAVSMLVQQMEEGLGVQLFDRSRTATTLTEAGRELLPLIQRILDDLRQVVEGASDLRSLRQGVLRVVAPQMLACTWIPPVLAAFGKQYPGIHLRMADANADDVVAKVRHGDAELGIGPERSVGDDIAGELLMNVPIRLVCAQTHALAARGSVRWKDLSDERWVVYLSDFTRELERALHEHGGPGGQMHSASEVGYLTTALALVGAGVGVIAVPDYARAFSRNFGLAFLALREPDINRKFFVYRRRGQNLSPAAKSFVDALHRHASEPEAAVS